MNSQIKQDIIAFAQSKGVDLVGFVSTAHLNRVIPTSYTPQNVWAEAKTVISLGQHLVRGAVAVGCDSAVQNARWAAWRCNELLNHRAMELALFIESLGGDALPLSNGTMAEPDWKNMGIFGELSHRHIAAEAGLGVIGVPTYCITPEYGPRVYFISLLTTLELEPDRPLAWAPCGTDCDACIKACPNQAIVRRRRTILKSRCIPLAQPQGPMNLQKYIRSIIEVPPREAVEMVNNFDFARYFRALVQGVGTIAGCFHCLAACPIQGVDRAGLPRKGW